MFKIDPEKRFVISFEEITAPLLLIKSRVFCRRIIEAIVRKTKTPAAIKPRKRIWF
jgi:hypothetical protein